MRLSRGVVDEGGVEQNEILMVFSLRYRRVKLHSEFTMKYLGGVLELFEYSILNTLTVHSVE